jgi:hypothetical protein
MKESMLNRVDLRHFAKVTKLFKQIVESVPMIFYVQNGITPTYLPTHIPRTPLRSHAQAHATCPTIAIM